MSGSIEALPRPCSYPDFADGHAYGGLEITLIRDGNWRLASGPVAAGRSIFLALLRSGSACLTTAGQDLVLRPGQMALASQGDAIHGIGMQMLVASMPESSVSVYCSSLEAVQGVVIDPGSGVARLVAHLIEDLGTQDFVPAGTSLLVQHVIGLVDLMCAELSGSLCSERAVMLQRAKQYIEDNLGEIELTPDAIAAVLNVSTRSLNRLFAHEGLTVASWTRGRRLEHCRMELSDPRYEDDSVSMIGARWGLCDAAHFSRLFKQSFGVSPREYRSRGSSRIPCPGLGERSPSYAVA